MNKLSQGALDLFLALANDAANWSGTPLVDVNEKGKGYLTDLKRKGLVTTFTDDGDTFASFTPAGQLLAYHNDINLG